MSNKILIVFCFLCGVIFSKVDYTIIIDRNIFSPKYLEKKEVVKLPEVVKKLSLPEPDKIFNLVGTATFEEDPTKNVVILENLKTRKMNFYKVGDVVDGFKIIEIAEKEVILEYEEEQYSLSEAGSVCLTIPENAIVFEIKMRPLFNIMESQSDLVENIEVKKIKDGDNKLTGFKINGIEEGSFLEEFGLQNGDVITEINGNLPENADFYIDFYEGILKGEIKRVEVKFLRDNKEQTYIYHFIP